MLTWYCKSYQQLSADQLFAIFKARQQVFIVEQNCPYPDIDQLDKQCLHLFACNDSTAANTEPEILAYLRIIPPGAQYPQASFGRVLTTESARGTGVGKTLVAKALQQLQRVYPSADIKISAQSYLQDFYARFGFETISDIYLEDDIEHLDMLLKRD
ncbi:MAG: GNAT family N-acetyltransferase [Pseudomonadales bacterium]|nr:GNAT family N-acetyltransferase [Pseudomonadales bacterium]NRA17062.1 GNAT family N-acetyltransferase [Oceanospirillaceae bacterium]